MPEVVTTSDERGAKIVKRMEALKARRHNWERHWQEIGNYIVPKKDDIFGERNKGEQKHNLLYDSTSIFANETMASALHGMLTNPASVWFGLSTGIPDLDKDPAVREWLEHVVDVMVKTFNRSNFQTQIHEVYIDLGGFGTSLLRVLEDDEDDIRFEARPIYEALIAENFKGKVDTVYYEYEMTAQQIKQQFGEEVMDDMLREKVTDDPLFKELVIHAVEPREQSPMKSKDVKKNMKFASFHVLKRNHKILKEDGFRENPNIVSRWTKLSGEIYGRSPGMKSLPDTKMLNKMKKATIEAAQLQVAPVLQVPDDGVLLPIRTAPNSVNYYRSGTKDRIEPLLTGGRIDISEALMNDVRNQILQAFFIDQLQLVQQDRMTTTEVLQRRDEQLRLLGPILGRQNNELLKPLVERVFGILSRKNKFKEPPEILRGRDLDVRYVSQIARAQMIAEADTVTRAFQFLAPFFEIKPEILDNFSGDGMVEFAKETFGVPEEVMTSAREKREIRDGRLEAQQEQVNLDQAEQASQVAKNTGNVAGET
jgi:hypothetical protein